MPGVSTTSSSCPIARLHVALTGRRFPASSTARAVRTTSSPAVTASCEVAASRRTTSPKTTLTSSVAVKPESSTCRRTGPMSTGVHRGPSSEAATCPDGMVQLDNATSTGAEAPSESLRRARSVTDCPARSDIGSPSNSMSSMAASAGSTATLPFALRFPATEVAVTFHTPGRVGKKTPSVSTTPWFEDHRRPPTASYGIEKPLASTREGRRRRPWPLRMDIPVGNTMATGSPGTTSTTCVASRSNKRIPISYEPGVERTTTGDPTPS